MIGQAFSAEWTKTLRQRPAFFWAYVFPPLVGLVVGLIQLVWTHNTNPLVAAMTQPSLLKPLLDGAGQCRNPLTLLFLILGAANLFAGEYRWLTWRYQLVRNTRLNILAAKLAVFVLACGISLLLFMAGGLLLAVLDAMLNQTALKPFPAGGGASVVATTGLALLDLAGMGAMVALASVFTRTLTGAIISIIVFSLVMFFAEQQLVARGVEWAQPFLPGLAFQKLMAMALGLGGQIPLNALPPGGPWSPLLTELGWLAVPAVLAGLIFVRQDLSRE
jgi:ABC-2 type transport system permease protein